MSKQPILRQGDVLLTPVKSLPQGCTEVPLDKGRIVLAYGEVTGHAHAIADHGLRAASEPSLRDQVFDQIEATTPRAAEIAEAAIARARLWRAPNGERFLEVKEPVSLKHEEHTAHTIPPGIYQVPTQVEYTPAELVRVTD